MKKSNQQKANLGHAITFFRKKRGITQIKLAQLCDIKSPFISKIENGLKYPTADLMRKITNSLNISTDELLSKAFLLDSENLSPKKILMLQELKALVEQLLDKELTSQ